jgi:hypothetical protein
MLRASYTIVVLALRHGVPRQKGMGSVGRGASDAGLIRTPVACAPRDAARLHALGRARRCARIQESVAVQLDPVLPVAWTTADLAIRERAAAGARLII